MSWEAYILENAGKLSYGYSKKTGRGFWEIWAVKNIGMGTGKVWVPGNIGMGSGKGMGTRKHRYGFW